MRTVAIVFFTCVGLAELACALSGTIYALVKKSAWSFILLEGPGSERRQRVTSLVLGVLSLCVALFLYVAPESAWRKP